MNRVKMVLAILAAVIVTIIIFQNIETVPVELLIWTISLSKAILLAIVLLVGFLLGMYMSRRWRRK